MPRASDPYDIEIGRRVRALRIARGMSLEALGGRLGVTYQQVQKYEAGVNRIGAGRLRRIAEMFDVPLTSLVGSPEESKGGRNDVLALLTTTDAARLLEAYSRIENRYVRLALIRLARGLAERHGRRPDGAK